MMVCKKRNRNRLNVVVVVVFVALPSLSTASLFRFFFRLVFDFFFVSFCKKEYQKDAPNLIKCHEIAFASTHTHAQLGSALMYWIKL